MPRSPGTARFLDFDAAEVNYGLIIEGLHPFTTGTTPQESPRRGAYKQQHHRESSPWHVGLRLLPVFAMVAMSALTASCAGEEPKDPDHDNHHRDAGHDVFASSACTGRPWRQDRRPKEATSLRGGTPHVMTNRRPDDAEAVVTDTLPAGSATCDDAAVGCP